MVLVKNGPFFHLLVFGQHRPGKCVLPYSIAKKRVSKLQKQEVQKVEKIVIFSKGLVRGFGQKLAIFPSFF